jgi:hypothetical protein
MSEEAWGLAAYGIVASIVSNRGEDFMVNEQSSETAEAAHGARSKARAAWS